MPNTTEPQHQEPGFWTRVARTIEAIERTETDDMRDEIERLSTRQSALEKELNERSKV